MMKKYSKPAWWLLDGLVLLLVGLLFGIHWLHLTTSVETLLQFFLILAFYGLVMFWLHTNEAAIAREDQAKLRVLNPQFHLTQVQARYRQTMTRSGEAKDSTILKF